MIFKLIKRLATVSELTGKLPENWKCFEKEKENRSNGESVCHFGWFTKVFQTSSTIKKNFSVQ